MLKAWTVLVLCGLLPCSHGVAENILSVARLDKAVLENVLSDTLANGNLLQGLLGGGLLGGDLLGGLTGSILGGQGGGLLGSVLGGQGGGPLGGDLLGGLTEGILGGQEDGPLGGVLGGQGGGLLGGVLGGQGGGPLGEDLLGGLTEGILGSQEDGPLGGVLGGQGGGPLGGVLGGQGGGPLGGVLGGQGGGLLGGELLGGLTEGILGGRGGGLLGVLGSRGGLLGLKIVDIVLPRVSLELLPGVGLGVNIYAKVAIDGNTVLSGLLNLMVEVNITARARLVLLDSGAPRLLVENCRTHLGGVQILSGFLPLSLDRTLTSVLSNVIPAVLCPVVDVVVNLVNVLLGTVNSVCPFGSLGKLHYTLAGLPLFSGQHIILNLNLLLLDPQGQAVALPAAQLPSLPLPLPGNHTSQLLLSSDLLTSLLRLLVAKGGFNADITEQTLNGAVPLTTAALRSVLPEIAQLLPADLPLVVKVRVSELPAVALQKGQVTVTLTASAEVFARTRAGLRALLGVEANVVLSGRVTVTATKLAVSFSLQSIGLKASSSEIGSFDVSGLTNWLADVLRVGYLPVINGALKIGIPLPNLLNLNLADAAVTTLQDAFVVDVPPKLL